MTSNPPASFSSLSLADMPRYRALHDACRTRAADYSFTNLWGWAEHYGLEWRFTDELCWIRQTLPTVRYWAPVGKWQETDWADCPELASGMEFIRVPEKLQTMWEQALPGRVDAAETRGQWDYLYNAQELAALGGNRFHKKKNLLNQFIKLYPDHIYTAMTLDCVESVLKMQKEWFHWRENEMSEALIAENTAVMRVLSHWDQLPGLVGGTLMMQGKVIGYTVGEQLTDDTLVVHFEKGATDFKGIYQAINCFFVRDVGDAYTYINREQDLDDEGLRKAKESYNPVKYVKKSTVKIR